MTIMEEVFANDDDNAAKVMNGWLKIYISIRHLRDLVLEGSKIPLRVSFDGLHRGLITSVVFMGG